MSFEHDPEFVDGELVERGRPDREHAETVQDVIGAFGSLHRAKRLWVGPALGVRVTAEKIRLPDFCAYRERPTEKLPTNPPLLAVEVVSPNERYSDLNKKLKEYHAWGVEHVWVADPHARELRVYDEAGMRNVLQLELPEFGITLTADDLFQ